MTSPPPLPFDLITGFLPHLVMRYFNCNDTYGRPSVLSVFTGYTYMEEGGSPTKWCEQGWFQVGTKCVRRTDEYFTRVDYYDACAADGAAPWAPGTSPTDWSVLETAGRAINDLSPAWVAAAASGGWEREVYEVRRAEVPLLVDFVDDIKVRLSHPLHRLPAIPNHKAASYIPYERDMYGRGQGFVWDHTEKMYPGYCWKEMEEDYCRPCPAGRYRWTNGVCYSCGIGKMSTPGASSPFQCFDCPSGRYADPDRGSCDVCPRGRYYVAANHGQRFTQVCQPCPGRNHVGASTVRGMVSASLLPDQRSLAVRVVHIYPKIIHTANCTDIGCLRRVHRRYGPRRRCPDGLST